MNLAYASGQEALVFRPGETYGSMAAVSLFWTTPAIDDEAVTTLFEEHFVRLTRAARLLVDNHEEAEEIVQEAFTRLLTSRRRMRKLEDAPAYLTTIVLNLSRSAVRRRSTARQKMPQVEHDTRVELDKRYDRDAPELAAVSRETSSELLEGLSCLPERQRECLVLRYLLSLSEAEIAESLGISKGSVKTHTSRGLDALQSRLEELR